MSDTFTDNSGSAVHTLVRQSFGPAQGGRMQVWHWLCSFQNWPEIIGGLQEAKQLDDGEPGRGSRIRLKWESEDEIWEISYWHPGLRLALQYENSLGIYGYEITIENSSQPHTYLLILKFQARYRTLWRILAPLLRSMEMRRARRRFGALLAGLSKLHSQV